jgi:hypothetical protein
LKVFEKSNYSSVKWVRYMTRAGNYEIRYVLIVLSSRKTKDRYPAFPGNYLLTTPQILISPVLPGFHEFMKACIVHSAYLGVFSSCIS